MEGGGGDESTSSSQQPNSSCDCETCPQNIRILLDGSSPEFKDFLEYHAANYRQLKPHIEITLELVDGGEEGFQERLLLLASVSDENDSAPDSNNRVSNDDSYNDSDDALWDGTIFPTQLTGALMNANALWDLSDFVQQSFELEWTEVLPFYRQLLASYGNVDQPSTSTTRMLPLDGDLLSLYYRRDLFEQYNRTVPRTWQEYNQEAKFFHGQPLGPGGSELSGSCVSRIDQCGNDYWTSLILASITQSMGTSSGFFLDPKSLDPLFGVAMDETLRLLAEQLTYGHADELIGDCLEANFGLNQGNCAMTYNWGNQITIGNDISNSNYDIGVAPTPGSPRVLDRSTGKLMNCTSELCPHGIYYEDLGRYVNHAPYAAFGGWAAGVSNGSPQGRQYATADFFAYVSNNLQSLGDVLPNPRSIFAQPYRYSHATSSNWIDAGFDPTLANEYAQSIRSINSENAVLELRVPPSRSLRQVVDEEVFDYLLTMKENPEITPAYASVLRGEATNRMEQRIQDLVKAEEASDVPLSESYRTSLGYTSVSESESMNYINEDFRDAGWGLGGLICVAALSLIIWTLRSRNNRVMKAFQPFLLIQSSIGIFLLGATVIPLGFDDSFFDADVLNIICMLPPWLYVFGFTIFFSSVYSKIRQCMKIYKEPHKYDVLVVEPRAAMRLCMRLLILNGTILGLWTGIDPLQWVREEVEGGTVFEDGTVETYGVCKGGNVSTGFATILFFVNLMICMIATMQAFTCRFLVLEYNEMQWLPLSIFPFVEVWLVGGPIVALVQDQPPVLFVVLTMITVVGSVTAAMAVFAPKDWYIRKVKYSKAPVNKKAPPRTSSAGIMVLKHPTVESQKQLEDLQNHFEQVQAWNTELEIDIRVMKDKFKGFTMSEKFAVRESLFRDAADNDSPSRGAEEFEQTERSQANEDDLAAMEHFEQVWVMPDEDEEEETEVVPIAVRSSISGSHSSMDSMNKEENVSAAASTSSSGSASRGMVAPPNSMEDEESKSSGSSFHEDPLARIARMVAEDEAAEEARARSAASTSPSASASRGVVAPPTEMDDGSKSSGSSFHEDPLVRLARMVAEDEAAEEAGATSAVSISPSASPSRRVVAPTNSMDGDGSISSRNSVPEDPLARIARMVAEEDAEADSTALASSSPSAPANTVAPPMETDDGLKSSRNSVPEDPFARIARMSKDEEAAAPLQLSPDSNGVAIYEDQESREMPTPILISRTFPQSPRSSNGSRQSSEDYLATAEAHKKLASYSAASNSTTDTQPGSGGESSSPNQDRLDIELLPLGSNIDVPPQDDQFEESDSDDSDAIIRKKDFHDLDSMIQSDDLDALETKTALLAASVKAKLAVSHLADLSGESREDASAVNDSGFEYGSYIVPFNVAKETSSQEGLSDLDISKISSDQGDGNFVSMSDSILESPARNGPHRASGSEYLLSLTGSSVASDQTSPNGSRSSSGIAIVASAGESSGTDVKKVDGVTTWNLPAEHEEGMHLTQKAGEPSQGDWRERPTGVVFDPTVVDNVGRTSPRQTVPRSPMSKTGNSQKIAEQDVSQTNSSKSYSLSNWSAVGITASVLADWSDSQSTASYAESYADSISSLEATTRASALDTPLANQLDTLVGKMDWDGVKHAAETFEVPPDDQNKLASIDGKRRKKRELEAWRSSISRSFTKGPEV